jgi:putative DNA primase/helicase
VPLTANHDGDPPASERPSPVPVIADNIPLELRKTPQWVGWRWDWIGKKWTKPPYSVRTGRKCDKTNPTNWVSFDEALAEYQRGRFDGVGFCFTADDPYAGIDLDDCLDPTTGKLSAGAQHVIRLASSYTEISPSGKGAKIYTRAKLPQGTRHADHKRGFEVYEAAAYFCVTGRHLEGTPGEITDCQEQIPALLRFMFGEPPGQASALPEGGADQIEKAREVLVGLDPARAADYHDWISVGMALHATSPALLADWDAWSRSCPEKYVPGECATRWRSFGGSPNSLTLGTLIHMAQQDGWVPPWTKNGHGTHASHGKRRVTIEQLADAIQAENHFAQDAGGKLHRYAEGVYKRQAEQFVRVQVKRLLIKWGAAGDWSSHRANEVVEFIRADAPQLWVCPPLDVVNVENGLLRIADRQLLPHSHEHLSSVQLPVKYDPAASCPNIEAFVQEVFPSDAHTLAWEIPACLMIPDKSIQKAMLLTGEGENGKSTYLALTRAFLGPTNTSSVSLQRMESDKFAAVRLMGKLANICPDLPSEHLAGTSVFKAVTGDDPLTGEYKFGDSFDFIPFARLVFSANHPPRSTDSSHAFFRRWIAIPFDHIIPAERRLSRNVIDANLQAPQELSGLLNKALDALGPLKSRGDFTQPPSVIEALAEFREVTDPMAVWLDRCTINACQLFVPKATLRTAYNTVAQQQGQLVLGKKAFGQALRRLRPQIGEAQRSVSGEYPWCYTGIGLRGIGGEES